MWSSEVEVSLTANVSYTKTASKTRTCNVEEKSNKLKANIWCDNPLRFFFFSKQYPKVQCVHFLKKRAVSFTEHQGQWDTVLLKTLSVSTFGVKPKCLHYVFVLNVSLT